jgi:hypothetical protein
VSEWKPNLKHDHVFVIVRIDRYASIATSIESSITVVKAVWTEERAQSEVARLNNLQTGNGSTYLWQVTRLERRSEEQIPYDQKSSPTC